MSVRCIALAATLALATTAVQAEPEIAVFDFDLLNTSPAPSTPAELARTKGLRDDLRADLQNSRIYNVISIDPVRPELPQAGSGEPCASRRNCNAVPPTIATTRENAIEKLNSPTP